LCLNWDNRIEVQNVPINEDFIIDVAVDALEALWDTLEGVAEED
jgi:hypothetical protein